MCEFASDALSQEDLAYLRSLHVSPAQLMQEEEKQDREYNARLDAKYSLTPSVKQPPSSVRHTYASVVPTSRQAARTTSNTRPSSVSSRNAGIGRERRPPTANVRISRTPSIEIVDPPIIHEVDVYLFSHVRRRVYLSFGAKILLPLDRLGASLYSSLCLCGRGTWLYECGITVLHGHRTE